MKPAFKDSNLVRLIHELERTITELDQMDGMPSGGWAAEFSPSDSQVKSAIRRVMGHVKGRPPQPVKTKKDKDLWVDALTEALWGVCKIRATEFSRGEQLNCLAAIEGSAKTRSAIDGRGYLDYLKVFFADADAQTS